MEFGSCLNILRDGEAVKEYAETYGKIVSIMASGRPLPESLDMHMPHFFSCLTRDLGRQEKMICNNSMQALSCCLKLNLTDALENKHIEAALSGSLLCVAELETVKEYFEAMAVCCENSESIQFAKVVQIIHDTVFGSSRNKVCQHTLVEILQFVNRFDDHLKTQTDECKLMCLKTVLLLTTDSTSSVRKVALKTAETFLSKVDVKASFVTPIASCLKQQVVPKIKSLYLTNALILKEILTQQWPLILRIMGISIKKSSSLMNALLAIVESGFRHSEVQMKKASFKAWSCLIDCYAEDLEVLSSSRYMKLLMQPLMATQVSDELNLLRVEVLWNLACKLRSKLSTLFSTVCIPLLHSCLGNLDPKRLSRSSDKLTTPLKSRHSSVGSSATNNDVFYAALQASGYKATPRKASKNFEMQMRGVEILIHLMEVPWTGDVSQVATNGFKFSNLEVPLLSSPRTFSSHGSLFITAVSEVLCHMGGKLSDEIILFLWDRLSHHIHIHLEANLKKRKKETELFNLYLQTLQNVILSRGVPCQLCFFFIKGFLKLPEGILSSTFYGDSSNGMHGVPALGLLHMLFSKPLIDGMISNHELGGIVACACDLISCGLQNKLQLLSFVESVVRVLQDCLGIVAFGQAKSNLVNNLLPVLWIHMGTTLNKQIVKSQEVNQGDSLEHDFAAMYAFMLFPCFLPSHSISDCFHTWEKVYKSFLYCASLVTTMKSNEICKYISMTILTMYDTTLSESTFSFYVRVTSCLLQNAEFNHKGFAKASRLSYSDTSMPTNYPCETVVLDVHKNLQELFALLKLLFIHLQKLDSKTTTPEDLMEILCFAFINIQNTVDVLSLFRYFLPVIKRVVVLLGKGKLKEHFRNIIQSVQKALLEKSGSQAVVLDFLRDPDVLSFICSCIQLNDCDIGQSVVDLWQELVVKGPNHDKVCSSLHDDARDILFPVYVRLGWETGGLPGLSIAEQKAIPVQSSSIACVASGSPSKRSPALRKSDIPTTSYLPHGISESVCSVSCTSLFTNSYTSPVGRRREKNGLDATSFHCPHRCLVVQPNHTDIVHDDHPMPGNEGGKELSCGTVEKAKDEAIKLNESKCENDCHEHNQEGSNILANAISFQKGMEEDADDNRGNNLHNRNNQTMEERWSNEVQQDATKWNTHALYDDDNDCKRSGCNGPGQDPDTNSAVNISSDDATSNESKAHSYSEDQSCNDDSDCNASYEYIELVDASTNQTKGDLTYEETDDVANSKDLGVTPLDDSYEYVAVVDTSMNVTSNLPATEELNMLESGDHTSMSEANLTNTSFNTTSSVCSDSEYEEVAVVDMSTCVQSKNTYSATEEDTASHVCSNKPKKDEKMFICSGRTINADTENKMQRQQEQAIAKMPDVSVVAVDSEMSTGSSGDSGDESQFPDCMQSFGESRIEDVDGTMNMHEFTGTDYASGCDDETAEVQEYDTPDEYSDARASLSSVAVRTEDDNEESRLSEMVDISSNSTSSNSVFEASIVDMLDAVMTSSDKGVDDAKVNEDREEESSLNNKATSKKDSSACNSGPISKEHDKTGNLCNLGQAEKSVETDVPGPDTGEKKRPDSLEDESKLQAESGVGWSARVQKCHAEGGIPVVGSPCPGSPTASYGHRVESKEISSMYVRLPVAMDDQGGESLLGQSPGGRGILKRRLTVTTVVASPKNNRRVSFAEPISKSKRLEGPGGCIAPSPKSSLHQRRKHSPRAVSRRLSLPVEKKCILNNPVPVSPLSLRSTKIAEAIASIRAKDPARLDSSTSHCANLTSKVPVSLPSTSDGTVDFGVITMENLCDSQFLSLLKRNELEAILLHHIKTTTTLYEAFLKSLSDEVNDV